MSKFSNIFIEQCNLQTVNPYKESGSRFKESKIADIPLSNIKAIYPDIRAISADTVTENFTYYSAKELIGSEVNSIHAYGYKSFVTPYPKPVITEHRLQDGWDGISGEEPQGRVILAEYVSLKQREKETRTGYPGYLSGSGYIRLIPKITDPAAIEKVLSDVYHTVSVGSQVKSVIDSISGLDLLNDDLSDWTYHTKGKLVDDKLVYTSLGGITFKEVSWVNNPSDVRASKQSADVGYDALKILMGERKQNSKEFSLWDPVTNEKVEFPYAQWAETNFCESSLVNSVQLENNFVNVDLPKNNKKMKHTHSVLKRMVAEFDEAALSDDNREAVMKFVDTTISREGLESMIDSKFLEGNTSDVYKISDTESFADCTDNATVLFGDYDESAAKFGLAAYLINGGSVALENKTAPKVTLGQVFDLEESNPHFSVETDIDPVKLKEAKGVLPLSLQLLGVIVGAESQYWQRVDESIAFVFAKGAENYSYTLEQFDGLEGKALWAEFGAFLGEVESADFIKFIESVRTNETIKNLLNMTEGEFPKIEFEVDTKLDLTFDELNYLRKQVSETTDVNREALAATVGLVRKYGITVSEYQELAQSYKHLGGRVLEGLLSKLPTERKSDETDADIEKSEENSSEITEQIETPLLTKPTVDSTRNPIKRSWA